MATENGKGRDDLVREYKAGGWGVVSRFERQEGFGPVIWGEVRSSLSLSPRVLPVSARTAAD